MKSLNETEQALQRLSEVEAIASLLENKAGELKRYCRRTKAKLGEVSTSSRRKAEFEEKIALTIARRNARIKTIAASGN